MPWKPGDRPAGAAKNELKVGRAASSLVAFSMQTASGIYPPPHIFSCARHATLHFYAGAADRRPQD